MSKSWEHLDESSYRPRANPRGSRPRSKQRPAHSDAIEGFVTGVDRGRYTVALAAGTGSGIPISRDSAGIITCMKARELGKQGIVVGDRVSVVGDTSGRPDTLARVVAVADRATQLTRSSDAVEGADKVVVANADQLVITTALADPPPRPGLIDRCLVAAFDAGMTAILCLTKSDLLADGSPEDGLSPTDLSALYEPLGVKIVTVGKNDIGLIAPDSLTTLSSLLIGHISVLVGHSGVGKSTLINALVPGADRLTGHVNQVTGRGRHTSTSAIALRLPRRHGDDTNNDTTSDPAASVGESWIIDTPGIRSFGIAHVQPENILAAFDDVNKAATACQPNCDHSADDPQCALDPWAGDDPTGVRRHRLESVRRLLANRKESFE